MIPEHRKLQLKMKRLDKVFYNLDEEELHYALTRIEFLLNWRAEMQRQEYVTTERKVQGLVKGIRREERL